MNRKHLETGFGILLVGLLLYLAEPSRIYEVLKDVDVLTYLGAITLFLSTYIPITRRWQVLTRAQGFNTRFVDAFKVVAISYGFNKTLPANSGDLARSKIMARYENVESHGRVLGAVAVERSLDLVVLGGIIAFSSMFLASRFFDAVYVIVVPALVGATGVFLGLKFLHLDRLFSMLPGSLGSFAEKVAEGYRSSTPVELAEALFYSVLRWISEVAVFYILAVSLGIDLGLAESAFVTSMMSLVAAFPISPGGIGPVDLTGTGLLVISGLSYSAGISLVILQRTLGLLLMGIIGMAVYSLENYRSSS